MEDNKEKNYKNRTTHGRCLKLLAGAGCQQPPPRLQYASVETLKPRN